MSQGGTRWVIQEGREMGKEGGVWELTRSGLTVGRSSDRDIQLLVRRSMRGGSTLRQAPWACLCVCLFLYM